MKTYFLIQNNIMQRKLVLYIVICLVTACTFSSMLPYPIFSPYTNLTKANMYEINNYYETELNVKSSEQIKVLNWDWFDVVQYILPSIFKVIDVYSGKCYSVKLIGGHNHADVEPIDANNTQIFKDIYGGEWSWSRRPVWVQINDTTYLCASINGYPHGNSYVEGSNLGGHTCIHFLNSKTHGTEKVDEAHQSCIQYAYDHREEITNYLNLL